MIPLTAMLVLTTASQGVTARALNVVPVANAGLTGDTGQMPGVCVAAPTHLIVKATVAETHVTEPCIVAMRLGGLEGGVLIEVTVMVVHTAASSDVATRQTGHGDTVSVLVSRTSGTMHAREAAHAVVAGHAAWPEASVATPVVTLGHGLLE
jgi:hypothetical protein